MIPKIIHQIWFGERPEDIRQMMIGVRHKNPGWRIRIWHEDNVQELGIDLAKLKGQCHNWASVSNIVRLHAVSKLGGIYCDSDIRALKSFDPLTTYTAFSALQDEERHCNAFFGAEAGHPWITWQIEHEDELKDADAAKGVYLMSRAPRDLVWSIPTHWCYPYRWDAPVEQRVPHRDSLCEHVWLGSWSNK